MDLLMAVTLVEPFHDVQKRRNIVKGLCDTLPIKRLYTPQSIATVLMVLSRVGLIDDVSCEEYSKNLLRKLFFTPRYARIRPFFLWLVFIWNL